VKKKVGEENARHMINMMRSLASNLPISPFHLAAADDMESLLNEVLMYRVKSDGVALTSMLHPVSLGKPSKHKISKKSLETMVLETEWVGLTDDEIEGAIDEGFAFGLDDGNVSNKYVIRYARVIEAKLKEKNGN